MYCRFKSTDDFSTQNFDKLENVNSSEFYNFLMQEIEDKVFSLFFVHKYKIILQNNIDSKTKYYIYNDYSEIENTKIKNIYGIGFKETDNEFTCFVINNKDDWNDQINKFYSSVYKYIYKHKLYSIFPYEYKIKHITNCLITATIKKEISWTVAKTTSNIIYTAKYLGKQVTLFLYNDDENKKYEYLKIENDTFYTPYDDAQIFTHYRPFEELQAHIENYTYNNIDNLCELWLTDNNQQRNL